MRSRKTKNSNRRLIAIHKPYLGFLDSTVRQSVMLMKTFLCTLLILLHVVTFAQKGKFRRVCAASITASNLKKHLYTIAGAEMQGRGTATIGEQRAAQYIETCFKSLQLIPGSDTTFRQYFPLYRNLTTNSKIELEGVALECGRDYIPYAHSFDFKMHFSEISIVPDSIVNTTQISNLAQKLVIAKSLSAAIYAWEHGAAATLLINDQDTFPKLGDRGMYFDKFQDKITANIFLISETIARSILKGKYDLLYKLYEGDPSNYILSAYIKLELSKPYVKLYSSNVIGYIEGTDLKDEFLIVTAHYDHEGMRGDSIIYYGADDDGSGTVAILELAKAFSKAKSMGAGPRRSIVFMTVSGEEKGLWGSSYYSSRPIFPLEKTVVNLNIDMIGRVDPSYKGDTLNYVYAIGEDKLSSDLLKITESVNNKFVKLEIDRKYNNPKDP
jgi:hypothetical protein